MSSIIDIQNLRPTQKMTNKTIDFLSLDEYYKLATKIITKLARRYHGGMASILLKNDDLIANIAHAIMMADYNFNGKGSLFGYRKQSAYWAFTKYLCRYTKEKQLNAISLSNLMDDDGNNFDVPDSPQRNPSAIAESNENVEIAHSLVSDNRLSTRQQSYLRGHYIDGQTYDEIAKINGVSKEAVRLGINKAIEILKADNV